MASADRRCFFYGHEIQKVAEASSEKDKITELDAIKINEQAKDLVKQRLGEVGECCCYWWLLLVIIVCVGECCCCWG